MLLHDVGATFGEISGSCATRARDAFVADWRQHLSRYMLHCLEHASIAII